MHVIFNIVNYLSDLLNTENHFIDSVLDIFFFPSFSKFEGCFIYYHSIITESDLFLTVSFSIIFKVSTDDLADTEISLLDAKYSLRHLVGIRKGEIQEF